MGHGLPQNEDKGATNLAGRYRLIAELGQGGMATVYLAVAMGTSGFRKLAVVKLLRPEIAVDDEFVQMFLDEARLSARLNHPNIVHTYDVGVDEVGHLIAMEYLDGVSLHAATSKLAKNGGPLTFPMQAKILLEVIEGLRYAHELKDYDGRSLEIVHRDVTPHNIFITFDGQVKLLDFGIAKAATSSVRTATGVIKGKLTYMAPEQARGEPVDARADLYAVGVMLWEAVTGRRRWPTGLSQPALFTRLAAGEPPESPNAASFGYPAGIDDVILRSLATKPEGRFQTAVELRDALEPLLRDLPQVSMRDLGTMLSTAFAEGRNRLRDIVEEQFRAIDAGGHPSQPHMLPAVSPPGLITTSQSIDLPFPVPDSGGESLSRRLTAAALVRSAVAPSRLRSRFAIVVAAIAMSTTALVVALAFHRMQSSGGGVGTGTSPMTHESVGSSLPVPSLVTDVTPDARVRAETQGGETAQSAEARRVDGGRTNPLWVPTMAHGTIRPAPVSRDAPIASIPAPPAPTTTAAAESPSSGTLTRTPTGRPKVQLERDNPWP
ncbi:MAG: serine/threonine protein kinase [Myxococcota bacterium]|nr:serine/threonine protein kinase [Myxococcota bacterium]